jgi:pilus assembly protein CpaE
VAKTPAALVVDQDIQARFEMKQIVRASGLTVVADAGYGMEAISSAQEHNPDVIVVGANEPMERSIQTVESLIALLPDTPVIVYSDSREIDTVRKSMLAGARDFLQRPVRPDALRDSVLKAMEAEENRRLRKAGQAPGAATRGTIVTVFGAKGGIGKSTLSTNLGVALARQDHASVAIIDLDNGFGDVIGMLDIKPERTLVDLIRDIEKVDRDDLRKYLTRHELSGLDVLAGPSVLEWRSISPDDVRRVLELLARCYDTVVIDTSGTLNDFSELAVEVATMMLWITTTEFASVRDSIEAMRALKSLSYSDERIRVIVNAITGDDLVRTTAVQEALQREIFWSIPYDKKVRQGTHLGQPIVIRAPQSAAARSYVDLATAISGGRVDQGRKVFGSLRWRAGTPAAVAEGS